MNKKVELSVVGWIIIIGLFAVVCYWFAQPLQPLVSVLTYVQTILKMVIFVVLTIMQFDTILYNNNFKGKIKTFVVVSTLIIQVITMYVLFVNSSEFLRMADYNIIAWFYVALVSIVMLGFVVATVLFIIASLALLYEKINWAIEYPSASGLSSLPVIKYMFKQPKPTKKSNKKVKM